MILLFLRYPVTPPSLFYSAYLYWPMLRLACLIPMCIYTSVWSLAIRQNVHLYSMQASLLRNSTQSPLFWFWACLVPFGLSAFFDLWLTFAFVFRLRFLPAHLYLCFLDFCFLTQACLLIILLPDDLYYASLTTWLRILPEINNVLCICPGLHLAPYSDVTVLKPV